MSPDGTNDSGQVARADVGQGRAVAHDRAVEGVVALPTDPKALEELIARRRANLAATVDELVVRARPQEILRRSVADARGRVQAFATTEDGALRTERLAAVAGAAVAFLGLLLLLRRRNRPAR